LERDDDKFLLRFLRSEHYNIPKCLEKIIAYQSWRTKYQLGERLSALEVREQLEENFVCFLPSDKRGRSTLYLVGSHFDYTKYDPMKWVKAAYYVLEKLLDNENSQIHGITMIYNAHNQGFNNFSLAATKMLSSMFQGKMPVRLGMIAFVKEPKVFKIFWKMCQPFLSQSFKSRLYFYGNDFNLLKNNFSVPAIPTEFGGSYQPNFHKFISSLIESDSEHFILRGEVCPDNFSKSFEIVERYGGQIFVNQISNCYSEARSIGLQVDDRILSINDVEMPLKELRKIQCSTLHKIHIKILISRVVFDVWGRRLVQT